MVLERRWSKKCEDIEGFHSEINNFFTAFEAVNRRELNEMTSHSKNVHESRRLLFFRHQLHIVRSVAHSRFIVIYRSVQVPHFYFYCIGNFSLNFSCNISNPTTRTIQLPPPQALLIESSNRCGRKFRDAQAVLTLAGKAAKLPAHP